MVNSLQPAIETANQRLAGQRSISHFILLLSRRLPGQSFHTYSLANGGSTVESGEYNSAGELSYLYLLFARGLIIGKVEPYF